MTEVSGTPIEDKGQDTSVTHTYSAPSTGAFSADDGGHTAVAAHSRDAAASAETTSGEDRGQSEVDTQVARAAASPETIAAIRAHHRERVFWMEQRKRSDLALGAYLRTALGWTLAKPPAEREAIRVQAAAIITAGEKHVKAWRKIMAKAEKTGVPVALPDMPAELRPWAHIVVPQIEMRGRVDELESAATKAMTSLAATLPVHEWASSIRGFGPLGLAIIIGETGDLNNYANPGKVWKRMGVAVVNGKRQGGLQSTAPKAEWIEHGYSRVRRSRLYTIGVSLMMAGESPYRQLYLDRKAYERARAEAEGMTVAPASKIPKGKQNEYRSLGHIDNRSRRYVEKRLLRDLWKAWRSAKIRMPQGQTPLADPTLSNPQREAMEIVPKGQGSAASAAEPHAQREASR